MADMMSFDNINIRQIVSAAISNNAIIVDVREPERFRQGHIPMAVNLPFERISEAYVTFPKNRTLIVYCDTGGASIQAARMLSAQGYHVINCIGGLKNYNASLTK
jgi:thiosulfate sulfurtransferase